MAQTNEASSAATADANQSAAPAGEPTAPVVVLEASQDAGPKPSKRQLKDAEAAYASGAKKLDRDDLDGAETDFAHALELNPGNRRYGIAISVAREHRVTELVQQSTKARLGGDPQKAQALLEQARDMDPQNPIVLEHSQPESVPVAQQTKPASAATVSDPMSQPWHIENAGIAGALVLQSTNEVKSFDLRGQFKNVLRDVAGQFGIKVVLDPSVEDRSIRFSLENVTYERAMYVLSTMTHTFAVPIDGKTVLIAHDDATNRGRLERQLQETIDVPGATTAKLQEIANVIRNVFGVKEAVVDASAGRIIVRGPEELFGPLNRTLEPLMDTGGELMLDIRLYEIDKSSTVKAGTTLPTGFTAFNVNQAANQIVSSNQALVQQAIAQGFISSTATNLQIALALIGSGLVQSDLAKNLIGVFGGGTLQTGVASSTNLLTFNLGRNASETQTLDEVQLRVNDREEAVFRAGTRYPITTSTYTTGLSTAASSLSNTSINGVNVANLLSQFAGGTSATIPQVAYEDLGLTLKAKPTFQAGGRVSMQLDLTIQAISGSGVSDIPVLLNRHFVTSLTVADGESAMMVSDVNKTETAALAGIPGLSELPGLHPPTERDTERDSGQLVVVVTPHIVKKRLNDEAGPRMALSHSSPQ
ncbi:MAG TPA: hypothetical protein VHU44_03950 [Acidobacteriaceae bacterium]|jgi:Flp pilus assembly secretin CpaC|nr:hypothetical protein [Acidobacteriaceae bacterium]